MNSFVLNAEKETLNKKIIVCFMWYFSLDRFSFHSTPKQSFNSFSTRVKLEEHKNKISTIERRKNFFLLILFHRAVLIDRRIRITQVLVCVSLAQFFFSGIC